MSQQDEEFNWRQSLERLGQAALDLMTSLGARASDEPGHAATGTLITESRDVSGFTQIKLLGVGTLNITQTGTESLTISAEEDVLPLLTSEVVDGTLELGVKPRLPLKSLRRVTYTVTVKSLQGVQLSGAGTVHIVDLQTPSLSVAISGAGDVNVSGGAHAQTVKISGAGNYNAKALQSEAADVTITGAGNARINASQSLNVKMSGAGVITYYGAPQLSQRVTGIGSVKRGE
ncbi:MAG TPA: head GIN domain-containing protein [Ktedonobacterales bacterium]